MTAPFTTSALLGERVLGRLFLLSTDLIHTVPAHEWIVQRARKRRLAAATVLRAIHGFGRRGVVHPSLWHIVNAAPVILELVDDGDALNRFLAEEILPQLHHGTITLERAGVLLYRHRAAREPRTPLDLLGRIKDLSTLPEFEGSLKMTSNTDGVLLRIFAGESDTYESHPLHEAVVNKARELGLAGATVLRGSMGFGATSVLHTSKLLELSTDLPIVIELVDTEEKIRTLLPYLDSIIHEGLITMESVRILTYKHNPAGAAPVLPN